MTDHTVWFHVFPFFAVYPFTCREPRISHLSLIHVQQKAQSRKLRFTHWLGCHLAQVGRTLSWNPWIWRHSCSAGGPTILTKILFWIAKSFSKTCHISIHRYNVLASPFSPRYYSEWLSHSPKLRHLPIHRYMCWAHTSHQDGVMRS